MAFTNYHSRYGYPWRWAIVAEVCWRLERTSGRWGREPHPVRLITTRAYRWRKACERRGYAASPRNRHSNTQISEEDR